MVSILGSLLYNGVIQYIDDTLLYAKDENELLQKLEEFFARMCRHNAKLHPGKFKLFAKQLTWGGKEVSGAGVKPSRKRLQAISEIPEPTTLAELMTFVYGVAWFRGHLPYFAEAASPLYDLWKDTMEQFKKKTTNKAKKFQLKDLPQWEETGKRAFRQIKMMMADAVVNTYFDPAKQLCVFADASDEFYCMVFTQCVHGVEKLPWDEQVGQHSLLLVLSGRFRKAQLRWHIVEKEAYPFGVRLQEYSYWVNGGRYPTALFTDHKNLLALFNDKARPLSCTKPNRARLTRWGINLLSMKYVIYHIDGEENKLADLGSRWGSRFAQARRKVKSPQANTGNTLPGVFDGLTGGPRPLLNCFLHRLQPNQSAAKKVLRTEPPSVNNEVQRPDLDLDDGFIVPAPTHLVDRQKIADSQKEYRADRPKHLRQTAEEPKLWQNDKDQVWVPPKDKQLQKMLYAVAHQGMQGHRGFEVTPATLQSRFFWDTMKSDVAQWRKGCLQCLKFHEGNVIPRPLGSQLIAEFPGEILMMDYIKMGTSRSGYSYVLMLSINSLDWPNLCLPKRQHRSWQRGLRYGGQRKEVCRTGS